ncbi:MAG: 2,3-bisphosphoglycerate-independent phosphoglycerate mutase [bacterium]|jgi:2,3-bisphosphoglycerate-independent phosphoglycerate mutase
MGRELRPVLLMILDGWGLGCPAAGNACRQDAMPVLTRLLREYPAAALAAAGEAVGLLPGQMGDSNVGHLNIGAGRIVYQDLTRISRAVADGTFYRNKVLREAMERTKAFGTSLHLFGLLSDGGVHSHIDHLFALLDMAADYGIEKVFVHAFLDGRDVPPKSAGQYLDLLEKRLAAGPGIIATVMGRYYAMDRDQRWERVEQAYNAITGGAALRADSAAAALAEAYARGETDEFVRPTVISPAGDRPRGLVGDNDTIIFYNFRADRAREISRAFLTEDFTDFPRRPGFFPVHYVAFTEYAADIPAEIAFPPLDLRNTLGEVISRAGLRQLRIAETEKYAHVTFFFNGGKEEPFPGEKRVLIPSPAVATYDLQPEMSADKVKDAVLAATEKKEYDFCVLNFANLDMVGHTGDLAAAVQAVRIVDDCAGQVVQTVTADGGRVLIIADHGNVECMLDAATGKVHTAHTANRVPVILVDPERKAKLRDGILADVAPTVLDLLGLPRPQEMTGKTLLREE